MNELFEVHLVSGDVLVGTADGIDHDRLFLRDLKLPADMPASKPGTTAVILLSSVLWWRILA